jgi:hypothetical protein
MPEKPITKIELQDTLTKEGYIHAVKYNMLTRLCDNAKSLPWVMHLCTTPVDIADYNNSKTYNPFYTGLLFDNIDFLVGIANPAEFDAPLTKEQEEHIKYMKLSPDPRSANAALMEIFKGMGLSLPDKGWIQSFDHAIEQMLLKNPKFADTSIFQTTAAAYHAFYNADQNGEIYIEDTNDGLQGVLPTIMFSAGSIAEDLTEAWRQNTRSSRKNKHPLTPFAKQLNGKKTFGPLISAHCITSRNGARGENIYSFKKDEDGDLVTPTQYCVRRDGRVCPNIDQCAIPYLSNEGVDIILHDAFAKFIKNYENIRFAPVPEKKQKVLDFELLGKTLIGIMLKMPGNKILNFGQNKTSVVISVNNPGSICTGCPLAKAQLTKKTGQMGINWSTECSFRGHNRDARDKFSHAIIRLSVPSSSSPALTKLPADAFIANANCAKESNAAEVIGNLQQNSTNLPTAPREVDVTYKRN